MDRDTLLVLLAREGGYLRTVDACRRLNLTATDLPARRRQALEQALDRKLPRLALGNKKETA